MWVRLLKELRELAVPWAQATAVGLVAVALKPHWNVEILWLLGTYLASRLFGAEFDHRTLPRLLAQPLPRPRIWGEKMLAGALAIAALGAALLFDLGLAGTQGPRFGSRYALAALVALATGPAMSLWLRDSLRAFWAGLALPANVHVAAILIWSLASGGPNLPPAATVFVVYCAVLLALGYRRFLRLELTGGVARSDSSVGPEPAERPDRDLVSELVLKEVRLQRTGLLLVPIAVATGFLAWMLAWWRDTPVAGIGTLGEVLQVIGVVPAGALIVLVPMLLGANAVAWERQLGVLQWQLALPVSRRLQWRIKLAVCVGLTLLSGLLGTGLAWLLASRLSPGALTGMMPRIGLLALFCLAIGLYGSKLGRSPFHALGLGLVFGAATWYVWNLLGHTMGFASMIWPASLGLGSAACPVVLLVLFVLVWTLPRQEHLLAGRGLLRSAGPAVLLALSVMALGLQIYTLNRTSQELELEIAAHEPEIESVGGIASLDWLAAELELGERLEVDHLMHVIDFGYSASDHEEWQEYRRLRPAVSRFMDLSSALDGIDTSRQSIDVWYWGRMRSEVLEGSVWGKEQDPAAINYRALRRAMKWLPTGRGHPTPWSGFSIAPLWYQDHRQQQLDRRVRQNVILEAARLGQSFERQMALEPDRFEKLAGWRSEFFDRRVVRTEPVRKELTNG